MKTILVTNDDGRYGPGLKPLIHELKKFARVIAIVPDQERSATSHSITLHKPLRVYEVSAGMSIANGTPADCVRFGILSLVKQKVDLVVSGINSGPNLGQDVVYSGTVAGAREGALLGVPSFAISVGSWKKGNFPLSAKIGRMVAQTVLKNGLPGDIYLNVNVPHAVKGTQITSLGTRIYDEDIECRIDPRGLKYYWLGGKSISGKQQAGTDITAVDRGFVSITPLQLNPTAGHLFGTLQTWIKDLA